MTSKQHRRATRQDIIKLLNAISGEVITFYFENPSAMELYLDGNYASFSVEPFQMHFYARKKKSVIKYHIILSVTKQ